MRPSPLRHSLAVLRQKIGLSQKELAALVSRSTRTIQAIELGKLPLSEDLAAQIEDQTGVSSYVLLDGDPSKPLTNTSGATYMVDDFELAQAKKGPLPPAIQDVAFTFFHAYTWASFHKERLARVFAAASLSNPSRMQVALYRANEWIETMEREFGIECDEYLEFRDKMNVRTVWPDGGETEHSGLMPPGIREKSEANFIRTIRETHGDEKATNILESTGISNLKEKMKPAPKKAAGSSKKRP